MATTAPQLGRLLPRGAPVDARLSDAALAELVRRGDPSAFDVLYRRHGEALRRYAVAMLRRPDDAEEALQEAMLKAYRALAAGGAAATPRAWLFGIVRNACLDAMRASRDWAALSGDEEERGPGVHDRAELRDDLARLAGDLAALPPQLRSALLLRELCGLSHAEIGTALGAATADAKQLVYEARKRLHAFDDARRAPCAEIRRRLSDGDGRVVGSIRITAHMRCCRGCRDFQLSI
ncbi:MAG: RNA polymerase sigma factor, partial [Actinomycetota bacterium]